MFLIGAQGSVPPVAEEFLLIKELSVSESAELDALHARMFDR